MSAPDPLLDRDLLFGNPDRGSPKISPDGRFLAFLAPRDGVLNVWVAPTDDPGAARPITDDRGRGIQVTEWASSSERLLYAQDTDGDENWRLFAVSPDGTDPHPLTPAGSQMMLAGTSPRRPHEIVVTTNERDARLHDPYLVDVRTGERRLLYENPGFVGFDLDFDLELRLALSMEPDGSLTVHRAQRAGGELTGFVLDGSIPAEEVLTTRPLAFDVDGNEYWLDSRGRDTSALVRLAPDGTGTVLAEDPQADIASWLVERRTGRPQAAYSTWTEERLHVLDEAVRPHLERLAAHREGSVDVASRSLDDAVWVVGWHTEAGPVAYALYEAATGRIRELFLDRTALEGLPLTRRRPHVIRARDGLEMVSYLSLPRWLDQDGRPAEPLPMVLYVHGGPWHRDEPGYDSVHQLLANRGYAVLSVNFRGSTGFGKAFVNAANLEWGRRMHDDLLDAVDWAVAAGVARRDRIAIMGGSYGGYATLVGLAFTPDVFACGVDIVGPSSLVTLIGSFPPYWAPMKAQFITRVGTDETEEGRLFLMSRSPLSRAGDIRRPLLIAQGANDPRVKQAEADQIVDELRRRGIPVRYALFPDEGHGFQRPENRLAFFAVAEGFLAEHLGGRAEPAGEAVTRSSVQLS